MLFFLSFSFLFFPLFVYFWATTGILGLLLDLGSDHPWWASADYVWGERDQVQIIKVQVNDLSTEFYPQSFPESTRYFAVFENLLVAVTFYAFSWSFIWGWMSRHTKVARKKYSVYVSCHTPVEFVCVPANNL